jgi:hypothetical protein
VPVLRVTPSAFLQRVFAKHDLDAEAIPHIVDLARFAPVVRRPLGNAPYLVVTRNLEQIHDIPTVLRAMAGEALRVLHSAKLANALRRPGLEQAARYAWPRIRACGLAAYIDVVRGREAS